MQLNAFHARNRHKLPEIPHLSFLTSPPTPLLPTSSSSPLLSSPLLPHLLPHLFLPHLFFLTSPLLPSPSSLLLLAIHDFYTGFRQHLVSHCNKQMFRSFICANVLYVFCFLLIAVLSHIMVCPGAQRNPVSACNNQKNPCLLVVRDYNVLFEKMLILFFLIYLFG